ncbi:MAG: tRNA pseudouridine(55) synthase TruB [Candidatus Sungbacteria bacterium RIFCSPLOWO2_01_FULL_54_21]|uniref:tRNA pseudouridine synthase B n=1 Tax=Candidatus Sungbacteria bacterium RIFCSPLOWO2_01_FULL_54_21 TaxID=1802279 RepID=A0A1G2L4Z6_9BACT|nr:MAG: tRNA pseudouridine(55) synthase TruB [Candidatus Sungbacteria bacterium RIFCSPLOWO2_01_FULL_54_21]
MEQIIFIDKSKGITSFDVIRMLRRTLGVRKMGHAGTLDPNATGILIVGVGEGTKHLQKYIGLPKTYVMDILLGVRTDTGDITGNIIETSVCPTFNAGQVERILEGMIGSIALPIPSYSALKYKGKPRYEYARKGILIEQKTRNMEIYALSLKSIEYIDYRGLTSIVLKIEMDCASGTYARSVAEEIGRMLGVPATLKDLRRTRIGTFSVEQARILE